ncbi:hypothetical protein ACI2LC_46370 [Nonomuraea wenchangensis]|uniref:hypothetical protein n=1 Tax=Nonomuraea wenchangensis TaxID=568860 RepID=UPI0038504DB7
MPARIARTLLIAQGALAILGGLFLALIGMIATLGPGTAAGTSWLLILIPIVGLVVGVIAIALAVKWQTRRKWVWRSTVAFESVSLAPPVVVAFLEGDRSVVGGISIPIVVLVLLVMPSTRQWFDLDRSLENRQNPE